MRISFDPNRTVAFMLPDDTEPKTVFQLGFFDTALRTHLMDKISDVDVEKAGQTIGFWTEMVRYGLKGWTNMNNREGQPVVCTRAPHDITGVGSRERLTDEAINLINPDDIVPLGVEIFKLNVPMKNKEAEKN